MIDQSKKFASTATIFLFLLSMFTAVPKVGAAGPSITLSPSTISTGQVFTVIGTGFPASTDGVVWIDLNGDGKVDLSMWPQPYASLVTTTASGGFTVKLFASGIGTGTYNVLAQIPLSSKATVSTPLNIQEPATGDLQNLQTMLSNQLNSAQQSLSNQIAAVQSDLDNRMGSPKTGSSDTLFSLLYNIGNSITAGFQALSTQISQLSSSIDAHFTQLSVQVTTLSSRMETRFNDVDNHLDQINTTMISRDLALSDQVNTDYIQLTTRINAFENNMHDEFKGVNAQLDVIHRQTASISVQVDNLQTSVTGGFQLIQSQLTQLSNHMDNQFSTLSSQVTGLSNSMNTGFNSVNNNINAVSNQITNFQTDLEAKVGTPAKSSNKCPGCPPPDTLFSLLYGISSQVDTGFMSVNSQLASLSAVLGTPGTGETVFGDLHGVNSSLTTVQASVSNFQTNLGTPTTGETIFGDLQSIQTTLSTLSGLQTSITNLQNTLNKLSNTATVSSGAGFPSLTGAYPSPLPNHSYGYADIFSSPNGKVCTITVTFSTNGIRPGEFVQVISGGSPGFGQGLAYTPDTDTNGITITLAAKSAQFEAFFTSSPGSTNTIQVSYQYSAVCPAS